MKKYLIGWLCVAALAGVAQGVEGLQDGDNIVLIGDSITEQGYRRPWGYYHVLTNAAGEVAKAGGPKVNFIPLGYSGYQVKGWSNMERDSVTNTNVWTWYRNPGWNLKEVFDGKVDVIVIFLGMNDILQPSMHDTDEDRAKWLADYKTFVNNLRERCHPRQFVFATITPLTTDPMSPKNIVREKLNDALRKFAAEHGNYVAGFGAAVGRGVSELRRADPDYRMIPDFVHPNRAGHSLMAHELLRVLRLDSSSDVALSAYHEELTNCVRQGALPRKPKPVPAPWKLSEDGGEWKVYTATEDYTGGQNPGSIDPFQCFFGWQTNTLKAARRVWSEKDRDVKAVLSHQGFSETLDLTVALDGAEVWKDDLNRNGKNRIEKTLHLKQGWNALEITCIHHSWQRQFAFDLEPLDGDDLSDLRYDLK